MAAEYGAIRTFNANHITLIERRMVETRFFPVITRRTMASTNGARAVATLAYGERSSKMLPGDTTGV